MSIKLLGNMENLLRNLSFTEPEEALEYLTSADIEYSELKENAEKLAEKITDTHVNQDDRKFQTITQCILECIKRIYGFHSNVWISKSKLEFGLKNGEQPIVFKRINAQGELCEYNIINFDQIDFEIQNEYADDYEVLNNKPNQDKESLPQKIIKEEENSDLKKVITLLQNGENIFLTGYAGTGKSYILTKLKEKFKKNLTITSTTGIAAVNVRGQTLHSWAGVGLCKNPVYKTIEKIKTRTSTLKQILNCKVLAIDEISMLNMETFEYIDEVLKAIRGSREPFGGIQLLLIGDFFQLPPVEVDNGQERRYCFESYLWQDLKLKNVILNKNYRQTESDFVKALSDMRVNNLTKSDIELLNSRETYIDTFETDMLHIFSTNDEANRYNLAKFNMIDEPVKTFDALDAVYRGNKAVYDNFTENEQYVLDIFGKNCRVEKNIALKLGARVMLLTNMDFNKGLINGSCGIITEFNESTITVKFDNGITYPVPKHTFEYYYHDKLAAERLQFPIRLAYGITIHKSQGMTLDKLVVDCSRIFEKGQAYVAISRVKTLEGLFLKSFSPDKVLVDEKVANFYEKLEDAGDVKPLNIQLFSLDDDDIPQISDLEAKKLIKECVADFNCLYGKSGICNILFGSKSIYNSDFHSNAANSKYFSALKGRKKKDINLLIDELLANGELTVVHAAFGRPMLSVK